MKKTDHQGYCQNGGGIPHYCLPGTEWGAMSLFLGQYRIIEQE